MTLSSIFKRTLLARLALVFLIIWSGPGMLAANEVPADAARITLTLQEEPVEQALVKLGELAGLSIELVGALGDQRLSLRLDETTLEESIRRILYPSNYVAIWVDGGGLSILVLDDELTGGVLQSDIQQQADDLSKVSAAQWGGGNELLPPDESGGVVVLPEDLDRHVISGPLLMPYNIELVPPDSAEAFGLTVEDLEAWPGDQGNTIGPQDEIVPPDGDAIPGLTMADMKAAVSDPQIDPAEVELVPPDEPGDIGLTLRDLEADKGSRVHEPPLSITDMIPPD